MALKFLRLLVALGLAAVPLHAHPQTGFEFEPPEVDSEPDDALSLSRATPLPQTDKTVQINEHLSRAEAARRRGQRKTQIAELRRAHAIANGRDSGIVNLLAGALVQSGDREGARRLREGILATGLRPEEKLVHTTSLAVYAAESGAMATARKWIESSETLAREQEGNANQLLAQVRLHWARNALLLAQGKYREGEAEGRLAAAAVRKLGEAMGGRASAGQRYWRDLVEAQLATTLSRQGSIAESEWIHGNSLARSTRESGTASLSGARSAVELASAQLRQGRHQEALQQARLVLATHAPGEAAHPDPLLPVTRIITNALLVTGWSEVMAGRFELATAAFERRAQILGATAGGSVVWGYSMIRSGRAQAALPMLRAHYESSMRRSATLYATRERAGMYAYALLRAGRAPEARQLFATALPGLVNARQGRRAIDRADLFLETISNWIIEGYLESLAGEAKSGDARASAEMFRLADVARSSTVQRALALASTRARIADPELAGIARREQDLGNALAAHSRILEELLARAREPQTQNAISNLRREIAAATRERDALRREIGARFPKYSQLIDPQPTTAAQLQKLLKPGEVMLATYTAHDRTYVWALPQSGAARFAMTALGADELAARVKKLRAAVEVGDTPLAAFPAFDTASAHSLYEQLFKPVESAWSKGDTLMVVAHGALGQLPFALLPTASMAEPHSANFEAYRKVPWLIRRIAITQLPSVSALAALRSNFPASSAATMAFAGIGDPRFSIAPPPPAAYRELEVRTLRQDRQAPSDDSQDNNTAVSYGIDRLPPLPDTALEIREIASLLNATSENILLGQDASETNVKQSRLDRYRVVMFATHSLAPGDLDGLTQPALALSNPQVTGEPDVDGLLTLDEVLGLKLAADWVVLSACNTAAANGAGNEAVSGLGRAFFYAGAKALLVSNWPVETVSARLITTALFRLQSENPLLTRSQALRLTLLNLIDHGEMKQAPGRARMTYAHPMFWAPFSLVGDGG